MKRRAELSRSRRRQQRGAALIALLAVILMASIWTITSRMNEGSASFTAQVRARNAEVLNRAKLALIGYVAQRALTDSNPGRLPCPEAAGVIGTTSEGSVPTDSEANTPTASFACASVGRFPWRTLGSEKLVDATGEPLWYVVGPTWRLTTKDSSLAINSNTTGDIQVDGQRVVALIIAPSAAMDAQAATGCTARTQARATPSSTINALDYVECLDTGTLQYTTTAGSATFNDQFVRVTTDDVLPAIEAAIAKRIDSEIVPVLKTVYTDATWGTSSTNPAFPFPASFSDPTTSSYLGDSSLTQGLLPFNYHASSCSEARCSTNVITWGTPSWSSSGGPGYVYNAPGYEPGCSSAGYCYGYYYGGTVNISMADPANDITKGFRTISTAGHTASYYTYRWNTSTSIWELQSTQSASVSYSLASSGAANFNATATLPNYPSWGYYVITNNRPPDSNFTDHAILSSSNATTGWFVRNEWYRFTYYAIAANHRPGQSYSCTAGTNCLTVTNLADPTKQQAILVLAGRALSTLSQARSDATARSLLQNYLDGNVDTTNNNLTAYAQSTVGRSYNDRFISLSKNP